MKAYTTTLTRWIQHSDGSDSQAVLKVRVAHDPGCRTMPNGDPGWPESYDVEPISLTIGGHDACLSKDEWLIADMIENATVEPMEVDE